MFSKLPFILEIEISLPCVYSNCHVGKCLKGFDSVHDNQGLNTRNAEGYNFIDFNSLNTNYNRNEVFKLSGKLKGDNQGIV